MRASPFRAVSLKSCKTPFFLCGPTGVGKTELAILLAQRFQTEILGADAFQIYAGLPILTAQPTRQQQSQVLHHLVGTQPVHQAYDVRQYLEQAQSVLNRCEGGQGWRLYGVQKQASQPRTNSVIWVVGGSGLYVQALSSGLSSAPGTNLQLRQELKDWDLKALLERLHRSDPLAAQQIDVQNPRRVIRAIEICELSGQPFAHFRTRPASSALGFMCWRSREELKQRIACHITEMFQQGVLEEVASVRNQVGPTAAQAIGYAEVINILDGKISESTGRHAIYQATCRYAKRQMTWFRHQTDFVPIEMTGVKTTQDLHKIADVIQGYLEKHPG